MKWLKGLFLSAFPPEERPPFAVMKWKAKKNVTWLKILADENDAGFFYLVAENDLIYVFFFAIDPAYRGRHIGTKAVHMLLQKYAGKRIFLAIERTDEVADNLQERIKRKSFYLRCGLKELHQMVQEGSVTYELLGSGGAVDNREYTSLMKKWMGFPLFCLVKTQIIE